MIAGRPHGDYLQYKNGGCRCPKCTDACRVFTAQSRALKRHIAASAPPKIFAAGSISTTHLRDWK